MVVRRYRIPSSSRRRQLVRGALIASHRQYRPGGIQPATVERARMPARSSAYRQIIAMLIDGPTMRARRIHDRFRGCSAAIGVRIRAARPRRISGRSLSGAMAPVDAAIDYDEVDRTVAWQSRDLAVGRRGCDPRLLAAPRFRLRAGLCNRLSLRELSSRGYGPSLADKAPSMRT